MGKFLFYFFAIFGLVLFFSPVKALADEPSESPKVVINEVYYNPVGSDTGFEWVELYNTSETEDAILTGYDLYLDGSYYSFSAYTLGPNEYVVIHVNKIGIDTKSDLYQGSSSDSNMGNTSGSIALFNGVRSGSNLIDFVQYGAIGQTWQSDAIKNKIWTTGDYVLVALDGYSMARLSNGKDTDSVADWSNLVNVTIGTKNLALVPVDPPDPKPDPDPVTPMASTDLKTEINKNTVTFTWENADTQKLDFEIIVTNKDGVAVIDHEPPQDLTKMEYKTMLDWGSYTWQIIAKNSAGEAVDDGAKFELVAPVYSKNIIVNEVSPHPSNGTDNEFIELYNAGDEPENIYGWFLDDIEGGSAPFQIPSEDPIVDDEYWIEPGSYLVFYKSETGLSLNDTGDSARLLFPDGSVASSCLFLAASLDLAWARDKDLTWNWTEKLTPRAVNNIYLTPEKDDPVVSADEEDIQINNVPILIKTGDYRDYDNKLVKLTGTIISTSGNTFYLDDSSGQAKIYIQDKTGIKKPPMFKGDIFEILGIVNLYRNSWRVLPQKQDDVKLIKCIKSVDQSSEPVSKSSTSTTTKTSATTSKLAQVRAPDSVLPIIKEVKAAETSQVSSVNDPQKNSLVNFAKVLIGLGVVFLVLLVIKVRSFKSIRIIGGHFGEDET